MQVYDTPTVNPSLSFGEVDAIRRDVLAARDLLNRMLQLAAVNGIKVETRLVGCSTIGAARFGIQLYNLVEALPTEA